MATPFDSTVLKGPEFWDHLIKWAKQPAIQGLLAQRPPAQRNEYNDLGNLSEATSEQTITLRRFPRQRSRQSFRQRPSQRSSQRSSQRNTSRQRLPQRSTSQHSTSQQITSQHIGFAASSNYGPNPDESMAPEQWLQPTEQGQQILSMLMRLQIDIEFDLVEATRDCVRSSGMHELALLTNREKAELTHWCRVLDSIEQPTLQTNVARNGRLLLFWMGRRAIQNILNRVIYSAEPREVLEDRTPDSEQAFVPDPPTEEELALFFAEHPCDEDDEDNEDDGEEEGYREIYGEEFEEESEEQPEEQSDEHTGEDEEDEVEPEAEEDEEEDHQSIIDTVVDDSENGLDDEDEEGYMRHDLSLIYTADQQSQLFCQLDERLRILQLHMLNDTHDTLSALEQFEREPRCPPWPRLMRPRFSWAPTPQPEWGPSPAYHPSTMFTNPPSPSNMTSAHSIMIPLLPEINPAHPHMVSDTTVQDLDPLPPYPGAHTRVPRTVGEAGELELAGQRVELPPAYFRTLSLGDMSDRLVARCISAVAGQRIKEPWMVSRKAILRRVVLLSRCYLRRARDRHRVTELHDSGVCYDFDFDDECEMSEESPDSVAGTRAESGSEEREEGIEDRIMSLLRSIRDLIKRILWRNQTM